MVYLIPFISGILTMFFVRWFIDYFQLKRRVENIEDHKKQIVDDISGLWREHIRSREDINKNFQTIESKIEKMEMKKIFVMNEKLYNEKTLNEIGNI